MRVSRPTTPWSARSAPEGMARVFLAAERHPPRKVAIKVMNPDFSTPAFRARFTREIELTRGLSHPHIVPILAAQECLFVPDSPDDRATT